MAAHDIFQHPVSSEIHILLDCGIVSGGNEVKLGRELASVLHHSGGWVTSMVLCCLNSGLLQQPKWPSCKIRVLQQIPQTWPLAVLSGFSVAPTAKATSPSAPSPSSSRACMGGQHRVPESCLLLFCTWGIHPWSLAPHFLTLYVAGAVSMGQNGLQNGPHNMRKCAVKEQCCTAHGGGNDGHILIAP